MPRYVQCDCPCGGHTKEIPLIHGISRLRCSIYGFWTITVEQTTSFQWNITVRKRNGERQTREFIFLPEKDMLCR